jgi:hypothetical protein
MGRIKWLDTSSSEMVSCVSGGEDIMKEMSVMALGLARSRTRRRSWTDRGPGAGVGAGAAVVLKSQKSLAFYIKAAALNNAFCSTSLRPALGMSSSTALARYASSLAYFLINSLLSSSAADGRFEGSF